MPRVTFLPAGVTVEFDPATMPWTEHGLRGSVLDVAMNFGIPLEHACGGHCACTTCHVIVRKGQQNLSPMEEFEADRLEQAPGLTLHSRLACQCRVDGDVTVEIPGWNRNYAGESGALTGEGPAAPK